jgi:hypothetical protein
MPHLLTIATEKQPAPPPSFHCEETSQNNIDACRVEFAFTRLYSNGKIEHLIGKILTSFFPLDNL